MNDTHQRTELPAYLEIGNEHQNVVDENFLQLLNQPTINPAPTTWILSALTRCYASENDLAELNALLSSWNLVELYGFCLGMNIYDFFLLLPSIYQGPN